MGTHSQLYTNQLPIVIELLIENILLVGTLMRAFSRLQWFGLD